jgi:hypothetical protein
MEVEFLDSLVKLRLAIGFLGEREQFGWWQSSFFTQGSDAFLSPLFGRTQVLAQSNGVTQAAALIHDERIGIGNVYHLFRLPEDMEQNIHKALHEIKPNQLFPTTEAALKYLQKLSVKPNQSSVGPTRVGDKKSLTNLGSWKLVTGLYTDAFEKNIEIFPYFADVA